MTRILVTIGLLALLPGCAYEMASYRGAIDPLIAKWAAVGCKEQKPHQYSLECREIRLDMQMAYDKHHRKGAGEGDSGFRYIINLN